MGQNFVGCDREQELLLPPSLREWLPEGHLAWFVIDALEAMNRDAFYASYRADGHGRAALDPSMMLALLLYAYSTGQRSSRAIDDDASRPRRGALAPTLPPQRRSFGWFGELRRIR